MTGNRLLAAAFGAAAFMLSQSAAAFAMPTFGQALNVDCTTCHSGKPALNKYGRWIWRTAYTGIDPGELHSMIPAWIDQQASYNSQDSEGYPHQVVLGNTGIHVVGNGLGPSDSHGFGSDLSYHIQQWLIQDNSNAGGTLDTAWVAYNNLFNRNGHLYLGKAELPGPSFFSQWFTSEGWAPAELTVGEHTWNLDSNRWGAKLSYVGKHAYAEAGYFGSSADLNGATDFVAANDGKAFQWHAAYASDKSPFEAGFYGSVGTLSLAEGGVDRNYAVGSYFQVDPTHRLPGFVGLYQIQKDGNPGNGLPAASGYGYSFGPYWTIFPHWDSTLALRHQATYDGLGTFSQYNDVDVTVKLYRFLYAYTEAGLAPSNTDPRTGEVNGKVAWRFRLWWALPVGSFKQPES